MRRFVLTLTVIMMATAPAGAAERPRPPRAAAEAAPTAAELQSMLVPTPREVAATEAEPNAFRRPFLLKVAARLAEDLGRIPEERIEPVFSHYLRDLDGRPSALVVLYALDPQGASFERLADLAGRHQEHVRGFMAARGDDADSPWTVAGGDRYLTVIVGASPYAPRLVLLSRTPGLFVWRAFARQRVAEERGVAPAAAEVIRPFYEPRMPYDRSLGFLVRTGADADSVYFLPSRGHPYGMIEGLDELRRQRTALRLRRLERAGGRTGQPTAREYRAGWQPRASVSLAAAAASPRATDALTAAADVTAWGRMAAAVGEFRLASICAACSMLDEAAFYTGIDRYADVLSVDGCECEKVYEDGTRHAVASCDGFADDCCQWEGDDYIDTGNCLTHCICDCPYEEEYTEKTEYGKLIKGVPIFFQHTVESERDACPDQVAVGCVPLGFTELFVWWDHMGYEQLTADHRSSDGKVQWKQMAKALRNEYYNGRCTEDGATSTPGLSKKKKGTKRYLGETSYDYVFEADKYKSNDEWTAYSLIRDEIRENRPIGLSYCPAATSGSCDEGEIDDTWAHFALIVGYEDYNYGNFVHINNGWGGNQAALYEWEIPDEDVALYRLEILSPHDGAKWCGADDPGAYYATTTDADGSRSIGYTFQPSEFASLTAEATIAGATCQRLEVAETETWVETGTWHSDYKCFTPAVKNRLERAIEESMQELEDRTGPHDWIWE